MGRFWERFFENLPYFLEVLIPAAGMTVRIAAGAFVLAIAVGLVLALLQTLKIGVVTAAVRTYIEVIRGTPVLALLQTLKIGVVTAAVRTYIEPSFPNSGVTGCRGGRVSGETTSPSPGHLDEVIRGTPVLAQLFILYIGLTEFGIRFSPVQAAILGLGLNGGAYLGEVFRAGIQSIHAGQMEAALTVGMTPIAAMRWVVLPQALNVVVPPTTNYSIALLKDTAIVSAVAAPEIMFRARNLVMETYLSAQIYFLVALMYLVMSLILAFISRRIERRLAVSGATGARPGVA